MSLVISDRVKETTITTGTGTVSLGGTFGAFQSFGSSVGDGNQTYYGIENESRWEVGLGTYTASENTLSRDTVLDGSDGPGSPVDLYGVSIVFCTYPAKKAVYLDASNDVELSGNLNLTPYNKQVTTFKLSEAGNIFNAYVDDSVYDRTVSLHNNGTVSPTWKLGLRSSPKMFDASEPPQYGYVYGQDGDVGLVGNSASLFNLSNTNGFTVKHQGSTLIRAHGATGVSVDTDLDLKQGSTPTKLNVYNKFITTSSYERLSVYGQLSSNFIIAAEADGVGAVRDIEFPTTVQFTGDVVVDKTTKDAGLINFRASADADAASAISTLTNSGATTHHIQVEINGVKAWIACSTTDPT